VAEMTRSETGDDWRDTYELGKRRHAESSTTTCGHPRGCIVQMPCPDCGGMGAQVVNTGLMPEHGNLEQESCDRCAGAGYIGEMPCRHPRDCIAQGDGGTAHCAWYEEVARLSEPQDNVAHLEELLIRSSRRYNEAQLQLSKMREESITAMIGRHWVTKAELDECHAQVALLREELERAATCVKVIGNALQDSLETPGTVGTMLVSTAEWDECHAEVARLRELIPDTELLRRLADYASYDFTNQPPLFEDMRQKLHADAVAARVLADRIEEASSD